MPGKVLMFVRNSFEHDSRVLKQARTLIDSGVDVRLVAVVAPGLPTAEIRDGLRIERIDDDPLPTRITRRALAWLARRRGQADDASQRGTVIGVQDVERSGAVALVLRVALRIHLQLALWRWWRLGVSAAITEPADVYVAHDLDTLPIAVRAKSRLGGKVLYDSHELWTESGAVRGPVSRLAWQVLERRLMHHADQIITVSDPIAEELGGRYGVARPRVVLNAPYIERSRDEEADANLRSLFGLPANRLIALHVGGLSPGRGIEEVIQSAALLRDIAVVVLMGPASNARYAQGIRDLADKSDGRVVVAPPVPGSEVVAHATSADIGLVPQRAWTRNAALGLPNKLFECLAAGLPIVANDVPALRAVVTQYEVGLLCNGSQPVEIARAVRELADDPQRREAMAANARRAATDFSWERQRQVLIESFSALAQSS